MSNQTVADSTDQDRNRKIVLQCNGEILAITNVVQSVESSDNLVWK